MSAGPWRHQRSHRHRPPWFVSGRRLGRGGVVRERYGVLGVVVAEFHLCGFVMRSSTGDGESVCGWAFREGDPIPLNRAEIFNAYCHNPFSGEITSPEPGISYSDAPVIHI